MSRRSLLLSLLALTLAACGGAAAQGGAAASQPVGKNRLEMRLVSATEGSGIKVPTWDGKLFMFVEPRVWLTDADVSQVTLGKMPDGAPAIAIQLDQTAMLTLEDLTLKNQGRRIAVLVDGRIVIAPTIKDKIDTGKMSIVGPSPADTQKIYERIKSR
jgi:preprotein translocase subunit SecD